MKKPVDLGPLGILLLPVLFVAAGLSIPYALIVLCFQRRRERQLKKHLAIAGRLTNWSTITPKLKSGAGTLIVEEANKEERRVWWTNDIITENWNGDLPTFEVEYITHDRTHPFITWIVQQYLVDGSRSASLVMDAPMQFWSDFGTLSDSFRTAFPKARVIFTILTQRLLARE